MWLFACLQGDPAASKKGLGGLLLLSLTLG